MKIAARISNRASGYADEAETDGRRQLIGTAPKSAGRGSSINGRELLFPPFAICFCNDLCREAT